MMPGMSLGPDSGGKREQLLERDLRDDRRQRPSSGRYPPNSLFERGVNRCSGGRSFLCRAIARSPMLLREPLSGTTVHTFPGPDGEDSLGKGDHSPGVCKPCHAAQAGLPRPARPRAVQAQQYGSHRPGRLGEAEDSRRTSNVDRSAGHRHAAGHPRLAAACRRSGMLPIVSIYRRSSGSTSGRSPGGRGEHGHLSRVMTGSGPVRAATRQRVLDVVERLGYAPKRPVPRPGHLQSMIIGVLIPELAVRQFVRSLEHFTILLSPGSQVWEPFGEESRGVWRSLDAHLP
jgi:hypothetical protein